MEASLRRALEAGESADPKFRQSIYDASQRALERMVLARDLDESSADAQRNRLVETIMRVEDEYFAYYNSGEGHGPAEFPEAAHQDDDEEGLERPSPAEDHFRSLEREPANAGLHVDADPAQADEPDAAPDRWTPGADRDVRPPSLWNGRRRLLLVSVAGALALLALLAFIVVSMLGWNAGTERSAGAGTVDAASIPDPLWISAFTGSELEAVSTPNGGRIEAVSEPSGRKAVRVASATGVDGEIILSFGPGLVGELAGSNIRVELTAGSPDEAPREFSVRCVFGDASVCERQRFSTSMREEAFVFDVAVPAGVKTPAGLAVGPGLGSSGADLDIYSIRLRVIG